MSPQEKPTRNERVHEKQTLNFTMSLDLYVLSTTPHKNNPSISTVDELNSRKAPAQGREEETTKYISIIPSPLSARKAI